MKALIAVMSAAMLAACSASAEPPVFPHFEVEGGLVRDGANVLSDAVERELASALDAAQLTYGPQMAVVTVETLHGYEIADFSISYARAWGLGDGIRNDGVLMLVAPNERRVRIEVGKGIEGTFTDLFCQDVLDETVLPRFAEDNVEGGIVAGVEALIAQMRKHPTLPANDNAPGIVDEAA